MTDLDSPRRNNDCYFYYYSTCAKGDSCTFRHEPSALGCETMCSFWKEGKCLNVHCNFRHMELRKNRKAIQCYWETQPGGCLKPHCPFMHQNVKQSLNDYSVNKIGPTTDTSQTGKQSDISQATEKNFKNPVDSLVVNFEEESDTESAPSFSPDKTHIKKVKVKTLEEIRLEKIQEESAAYFSYHETEHAAPIPEAEDDLRHRLLIRMRKKRLQKDPVHEDLPKKQKLNFENASLEAHIDTVTGVQTRTILRKSRENISLDEHILQKRKQKSLPVTKKEDKEVSTIKIKTLAEIRAERLRKQEQAEPDSQCNQTSLKKRNCSIESEDEVSSTSKDEVEIKTVKQEQPRKRLKLERLSSTESNTTIFNVEDKKQKENHSQDPIKEVCSNFTIKEEECVEKSIDSESRVNSAEVSETVINAKEESNTVDLNQPNDLSEDTIKLSSRDEIDDKSDITKFDTRINIAEPENISETNWSESDLFPNKFAEEVLLLDDDDDYTNVTLKAEDELLEEIDDILKE